MNFEVKKVTCPHCNKQQNINVYPTINITLYPEMKNELLNGDIFNRVCRYCSKKIEIKHPLLYCDMENRFMVYYIPMIQSSKIIDTALEKEFEDMKPIKRRIVADIDTMKEKILILESGLDDMAIEITKLAVANVITEKGDKKILKGTFSFCYQEKNTIGFEFDTDSGPYCQSTRMEVYQKAEYIVRKTAMLDKNMTGFLKIDSDWADNMLFKFKLREKKREQYKKQSKLTSDPVEISMKIDSNKKVK